MLNTISFLNLANYFGFLAWVLVQSSIKNKKVVLFLLAFLVQTEIGYG
ncbi:MAG: hypothetical protein K9I36_07740 [Bacteroidia bacterium]|nr:hypothetical protein [Bacteroidia bacterium]